MQRPFLSVCTVLAASLSISGLLVLWNSHALMVYLIHLIGEERALGPQNVVRTNDGAVLLTNPGGMLL